MVRVRPLFSQDDYVCDLKFVMRTRLLLGLYNNMYTPKRLQIWTRLYCLVITIYSMYFAFVSVKTSTGFKFMFQTTKILLIFSNMLCSLYTADSYIIKLCTRVNLSDSTLTSSSEFLKAEKIVTYVCWIILLIKSIELFNYMATAGSFWIFVSHGVPYMLVDLVMEIRVINQFIVFALMLSRTAILRKKIERLGFRHVRNAKFGLNVYSEMYFRNMQNMNSTITPMKVLVAFDILSNSAGIIFLVCQIFNSGSNEKLTIDALVYFTHTIAKMIITMISCGFIVEATAVGVKTIQNLVVDELMQNPVKEERRAMYNLLELISALPVRISLFGVVNVDVASALSVLVTCTQRILVIIQTFK